MAPPSNWVGSMVPACPFSSEWGGFLHLFLSRGQWNLSSPLCVASKTTLWYDHDHIRRVMHS